MSTLQATSKLFSAAMSAQCTAERRTAGRGRASAGGIERDDGGALGRAEREEAVLELRVHRDLRELHGHGVLELVVEHRLTHDPVLRIDGEHEAREEGGRLLRR